MSAPTSFADLPSYDELPCKSAYWPYPPGSAREGAGMPGLCTPAYIADTAAREIRSGKRIGLTMPAQEMSHPFFGRQKFDIDVHHIAHFGVFDDVITFNPQGGSQWDGFRHHGMPTGLISGNTAEANRVPKDDEYVWYGGTTEKEIATPGNPRIGISYLADHGIIGRGVLFDYVDYASLHGISYSCYERYEVPLAHLLDMVGEYNLDLRPGDIFCLRIGAVTEYRTHTPASWAAAADIPPQTVVSAGLQTSEVLLRWIWDNHFCALVSDALAVEAFPPSDPSTALHHVCLAGWGIPLGELFDLDELASECKRTGRYSFFFNSVPFNVVGGVSTLPNAVAIL
ncbi:uncharacterized protein V1518DRAFT_422916 [Limtongia smithiae]|uniref:uncharacterized protein n=1 Tax=Limtongia smithiae TaxID=1125753 RepID=UPI0034CE0063